MKAAICVFPGSNCDRDVAVAVARYSGQAPLMVWHQETELPPVDVIILPGGFSYGDYLRAGSMAAHSPIMNAVKARAEAGVAILGICNGFQMLTEAGLLPGTLMRNQSCQFICRETFVKVEQCRPPFTANYPLGQPMKIYIAHDSGNYQAPEAELARLEGEGRIIWRYCDAAGEVNESANPNGSAHHIAGIINESGNVMGMMPHPERNADPALSAALSGRPLFEALA